MSDVVVIDSGGANIASLVFAFERLGARATVSKDPATIAAAPRLILPGVGAAANAMASLRASGLVDVITTLRQPVLGICLGMQLLCAHTDEGNQSCLGLVDARVRRLDGSPALPVPHMGWNQLHGLQADPLLAGLTGADYVYFVHGFAAPPHAATIASCAYGVPFSAALRIRNFWGTQFHPERSGAVGARVLRNFLQLGASCN